MSAFFGVYTYIDVIDVNGNQYNNSYYFEDRDIQGGFYLAADEKYEFSHNQEPHQWKIEENKKIDNSIDYIGKISHAKSVKGLLDLVLCIYGREDFLTDYVRETVETQNNFIPVDIPFNEIKIIKISEKYCDFIEGGEILTTISFENIDNELRVSNELSKVEKLDDDENDQNEMVEESPAPLVIDERLLQKYIDKYNSLDEDIRKYIYYHYKRDERGGYGVGQGPLIKNEEYKEVLNNPTALIENIVKFFELKEDSIDKYFNYKTEEHEETSSLFLHYDYPETINFKEKKILTSSLVVGAIGKQLKAKRASFQTAISGKTDIFISLSKYLNGVSLNKTIELKKKKPEVLILDFNYIEEWLNNNKKSKK